MLNDISFFVFMLNMFMNVFANVSYEIRRNNKIIALCCIAIKDITSEQRHSTSKATTTLKIQ